MEKKMGCRLRGEHSAFGWKKRKHNLGNPLTFPLQLIQTFTREGLTNTLELKQQLFPGISSFSFLIIFPRRKNRYKV